MKKISKFYNVAPELDILFFGKDSELHYYLPEEFDNKIRFEITDNGNLKVIQEL